VEGQQRSGQKVKAYCREHGLKSWQFFYWRKALEEKREAGGFMELGTGGGSDMVLECGGCRIGLKRGFDAGLLGEVLAVLRAG
jgi:hypothetical protein